MFFISHVICIICYILSMKKIPPRVGFLAGMFTRQERLALAFLIGVACLGMGVKWCRQRWPTPTPTLAWTEVSVNHADVPELIALPGIGPVLARRIAEDRQRLGPFLTLDDMARVKGVSPKTLGKLKGLVRFD